VPYRTYAPGDSLAGDTFARSGAATQDGSTGHTLSSVSTGVVRDAHFISGQRTLLIESSRTQLVSQTDNPSGSDWSNVGVTLTTGIADPMGGTTAVRVTLSASVNSILRTGVPYTNGQPHVGKIWARKTNSGGAGAFYIVSNDQSAWNTGIATKFTPTTDWQEFSSLVTLSTSTSINWLMFGNTDVSGNVDASCAGDIEFAFAQQEVASVASSTIPNTATNSPLTRGFDKLDWALPSGAAGTRYHKYIDLITGSIIEAVSAFTGSAITLDGSVDGPRAYLKLKWSDGTQTLAFMQALGEYIPGGGAWGSTAAALAFTALAAFPTQQAARIAPLIPPSAQAPPVRGPLARTDLGTIRAQWPEPTSGGVQRFVQIAPLTLTYGQQPPRIGPQKLINQSIERNAWPSPTEGGVQRIVQVAPLTLRYGQQVLTTPLSVQEQAVIRSWWPEAVVAPIAQTLARSAAWDPGTLTATPPIPVAALSPVETATIIGAWPDPLAPGRLPGTVKVAALTLPIGDQPPPRSVLDPAIRQAWRPSDTLPPALRPTQVVSVDQPQPLNRLNAAIVQTSWLGVIQPQVLRSTQIVSVDQPTPLRGNQIAIQSWFGVVGQPQVLLGTAAWNVPVVAASQPVPLSPWLTTVVATWRSDAMPLARMSVAAISLPTGSQPIPTAALSVSELVAIRSWAIPDLLQAMRPSTAWNIIVIAPPQPYVAPQLAISQWWTNPAIIVRPPRIVTLTLPTGDQPTPDDVLNANELVAIGAWNPAVITPRARVSVAAWVGSVIRPSGDTVRRAQYSVVLTSWERPALILRLRPVVVMASAAVATSTTQRFTLSML
jgi:hypothetical protein